MRIKILSDGKEHEGKDAREVVAAMKNSSPFNRELAVEAYMPKVKEWSGETTIDTSSPEAFLESLKRLGMIEIEA